MSDTQLTPQDIKFLNDDGRVSGDWYKFMEDMYQYSGLAKQNFPLFQDLSATSLTMTPDPALPPDLIPIVDVALCYQFDPDDIESLMFQLQPGHGYIDGTDVRPFVQWAPSSSATGNVVWKLAISWATIGGVFGPLQTFTFISAASGTANTHTFAETTEKLVGTGKKFSSIMQCVVFRDAINAADTYPDGAFLLCAGVHYMNSAHGGVQIWPET